MEYRRPLHARKNVTFDEFMAQMGLVPTWRYRNPTTSTIELELHHGDSGIENVLVTIGPGEEISLPKIWMAALTGLKWDAKRQVKHRSSGMAPQLIPLDGPAFGVPAPASDDTASVRSPRVRLSF